MGQHWEGMLKECKTKDSSMGDLTAMERENGLMSFAKHVRHVYIHIYNIHVLGFSLSSLFKAMVRRGTPSWNYFLGDWNYLKFKR